jgi:hypothetical protein
MLVEAFELSSEPLYSSVQNNSDVAVCVVPYSALADARIEACG